MFFFYILKDSVILSPEDMKDEVGNLCKKLEQKFLFRIIDKEGLCVYIVEYKILDSTVLHTEGDVVIQLEISLVLFKMYENEVFVGKIIENTKEGIVVCLKDLVNVFIPGPLLNSPAFYDENEKLWVWNCSKSSMFYYEVNREIRLKGYKSNFDAIPIAAITGTAEIEEITNEKGYFFIGKLNEDGLGPTAGWSSFE